MSLRIVRPGAQCLVEDLGRAHLARQGVSTGGALDRAALRLANRLVGNATSAAALEVLLGGFEAVAETRTVVAVTGAPGGVTIDGRPQPTHRALVVEPGQVLVLAAATTGLRRYLALRGGVAVAPVLGSRSTDPVTGIGPAPLAAGDLIATGEPVDDMPAADLAESAHAGAPITVRAMPGPRDDWVTADALRLLTTTPWRVGSSSDRVGLRLEGARLARCVTRELPSELVVRGAVQVPPSGEPVIFLADHPTTGGYPVIAVVLDADLDRLGQARPGDIVRISLT